MLQEQFLSAIVEVRIPVTLYLVNGIKLQGEIESFDQYGLLLRGSAQQFVYKHAISTIVPMREVAKPARTDGQALTSESSVNGLHPRRTRPP